MRPEATQAWFRRQIRTALVSLYDPAVLRASPLLTLFGLEERPDAISALRRALTEAIEALRPTQEAPSGSKGWRVYQVLRQRYTEQRSQGEVAAALALSIRQLQREEKLARELLAEALWTRHALNARVVPIAAASDPSDEDEGQEEQETAYTARVELERLHKSLPDELTDVALLVEDVLETIAPLLEAAHVQASLAPGEGVGPIPVQAPLLRQALLTLVEAAAACAPGGRVQAEVCPLPTALAIAVRAWRADTTSETPEPAGGPGAQASAAREAVPPERRSELGMARELVALCRGTCEQLPPTTGETFAVQLCLPSVEQVTVLAVDDNADALQLFQRYLAGTHYRLVGARDAEQGLALAVELKPRVILLDVMMPTQDGWTLLTTLREHPETRAIPAIVCTILGQRELAFALGAADFLRKPVSRSDLLGALERLFALPAIAAR